jgi:hypothetical protein
MTTTETAYDFHCRMTEETYKEFCQDNPDYSCDIQDWAEAEYSTLQEQECSNPFQTQAYSAGVYLGELTDDGGEAIHPDHLPRFTNEHTDLWKVMENCNSPDAHADNACDFMDDLIDLIKKHNPEVQLTQDNLIDPLNALMSLAVPQYKVVLGMWNHRLSPEKLEEFAKESHYDTLESYLD